MIDASDIDRIVAGQHNDPFSVLGTHRMDATSLSIRAFLPGAKEVSAIELNTKRLIGKL
jgi:1,4-alpha-glucan branching enzyme